MPTRAEPDSVWRLVSFYFSASARVIQQTSSVCPGGSELIPLCSGKKCPKLEIMDVATAGRFVFTRLHFSYGSYTLECKLLTLKTVPQSLCTPPTPRIGRRAQRREKTEEGAMRDRTI